SDCSRSAPLGQLALGFASSQGVVPNGDAVLAGRRQIRDLKVGAGASHAPAHGRDALTDHGAGRVQSLGEDTHVLCVLALALIDITGDALGPTTTMLLWKFPWNPGVSVKWPPWPPQA